VRCFCILQDIVYRCLVDFFYYPQIIIFWPVFTLFVVLFTVIFVAAYIALHAAFRILSIYSIVHPLFQILICRNNSSFVLNLGQCLTIYFVHCSTTWELGQLLTANNRH